MRRFQTLEQEWWMRLPDDVTQTLRAEGLDPHAMVKKKINLLD